MKDNGLTYTVRTATTGPGVTVAGYGSKSGQLVTSVSMASLPEERGGYGRSIKTVGSNRLRLNKPKYKGKTIR